MILRKLSLLLVFVVLIGCNQSETDTQPTSNEQGNSQSETNSTENSAADSEPLKTGKILARINGNPIYEDDLKGRNLEFVITEEIIYQVGLKQGIDKQYKDEVRQYEKKLVVNRTKAKIMEDAPPSKKISDEEIQTYYDNNKSRYSYTRMHEISFPDVNMGKEIKEKAEKGESLQDIANSYPDQNITVTDIGFDRVMVSKFDTQEIGSVSEVFQKPNGIYSVLKIVEIKEIPLSASKKSIRHLLESRSKAKMFDEYAWQAAQENNIEIEIIQ